MTGEELRRLRKRLGLTQAQLAEKTGLHPNSVAQMERDEMTITEAMSKFFRLLEKVERG